MTRLCAMCQADISHRDWRALYCSRYCREKAYRENNREHIKERKACDYQKRKGQVLAKNKEWYEANKSEISLRGKQARAAERGINLGDRRCLMCDSDISHRTLKAKYCESCSLVREQALKKKGNKERYQSNIDGERRKRKNYYEKNRDEINLRGRVARATALGIDLSERRCAACGTDISDRTLKAEYCQPCYQAREQELNRARANRAYTDNREERKAQVQAYARTPQGRAMRLAWERNNKGRIKTLKLRAHHLRRARKLGKQGNVSKEIVAHLLQSQRHRCAAPWCQRRISSHSRSRSHKFELDHIIPLAKGGLHDDTNLQLLCFPCHRKKGAKLPEDWYKEHGYLGLLTPPV